MKGPISGDGSNSTVRLLAVMFASFINISAAHQSISYPTPISFDLACRVGLGRNCPGPCPTQLLRKDQTPNNPSVTVRRGEELPVRILKNNHVGGFSRWSLVKVSDIYNKKKHAENSFLYSCADLEVTYCTKANQERDCRVDRLNQYYRHYLRIPKIYPDGVYVLGWIWYGGAVSTGTHGAFGDYYDCIYIRVKGGPLEDSYQPVFKAGDTMTGRGGMCKATTNRIGHCFREPCPFGNRATTLMKPVEFDGKRPAKILSRSFDDTQKKKTGSNAAPQKDKNPSAPVKNGPKPSIIPSPETSSTPKPWTIQNHSNVSTKNPENGKKDKDKEIAVASSTKPEPSQAAIVNLGGANTEDDGPPDTATGKAPMTEDGQDKRPEETATSEPNGTPKTHNRDAKGGAKAQRLREKKRRRQAKKKERREKRRRKAKAKKAKLEAKRVRRKRIMKEKARKKERRMRQKQRRKQAKRARREAKREAKRRGQRSFARSPRKEEHFQYEDCFENGAFPTDDGKIDYGDAVGKSRSTN